MNKKFKSIAIFERQMLTYDCFIFIIWQWNKFINVGEFFLWNLIHVQKRAQKTFRKIKWNVDTILILNINLQRLVVDWYFQIFWVTQRLKSYIVGIVLGIFHNDIIYQLCVHFLQKNSCQKQNRMTRKQTMKSYLPRFFIF